MPGLADLNSSAAGCGVVGGIAYSWAAELKYISAVTTNANGSITNFTMTTTGQWFKLEYDIDGTSNYAWTGNRSGRRRSYTQRSFMKFGGITESYLKHATDANGTCDIVLVHVMSDGTRITQGIEIDASATGGFTRLKIQQCLFLPSGNTDTAQAESRMEYIFEGESATPPQMCTLTDSALAAL